MIPRKVSNTLTRRNKVALLYSTFLDLLRAVSEGIDQGMGVLVEEGLGEGGGCIR